MPTTPKITIPKKWLEAFCKDHHIVKLALFGSVLSDRFSESSDVDILVEFDPQHVPGLFGIVPTLTPIFHKLFKYS